VRVGGARFNVHPEDIGQWAPHNLSTQALCKQRYEDINQVIAAGVFKPSRLTLVPAGREGTEALRYRSRQRPSALNKRTHRRATVPGR
jgi:hypothetical protein